MKVNISNETHSNMGFKKNIKPISGTGKNQINFNQSKEHFSSSQGKKSNEASPNKYLFENNKLIDSLNGHKIPNFKVLKNPESLHKKAESTTNMSKMNPNQKSFNNLKILSSLDSFKLMSNNNNPPQSNNSGRTSSNFKQNSNSTSTSTNHMKKNSENLFLVKNNTNNIFEKASFSQIRQEQFNKTGTSKALELISPESERNTKSKNELLFQNATKSPNMKKNNNYVEENKKAEFPNLYANNIHEENDLKKWLNDRMNHNNQSNNNIEESKSALRVTLNKNYSKGNLMSSKLYENSSNNSNQNNSSSLSNTLRNNSLNITNNFPKIKNDEVKREPSPSSDNDSMKLVRPVKSKKISIDDRKTNSVSQSKKDEINNSKENTSRENNQVSTFIRVFNVKSRAGMNFDGQRKTNQDNFIAKTNLLGLEDYHVFGVFDGHGLHGHFVSATVKQFFTDFYNRHEIYSNRTHKFSRGNIKESSIYERLKENEYEFVRSSFIRCEQELTRAKFEVNFSGTTSVVALLVGNKIIIANAGDSRAIMVVNNKKGKSISDDNEDSEYEPVQLSRDHKPDLEDEKERIIACNGRVDKYTENGIKSGPYRVWLKNENFPGLAMSRSIGDFVAGSVGCICEPEITEFEFTSDCRFIVIASDGVWEFLSNKRVMEIVLPFFKTNDPAAAAEKLIEESVKCWKKEDDVIDDITAVVIFLNKSF